MSILAVGSKAPDFELTSDDGTPFRLSAHKGKPVVLYFYAEDDTEGCTIENLEFTEEIPAFRELGVEVVGISEDTLEKHCKFRDKYRIGVPLLADPQHVAIDKYGVWGPKKLYGREYDGLLRTSYLIGPDGRIAAVWPVRRIKGHAATVLDAAREFVSR
jgi:peroxiredoxin Q/BCP